MNKKNVFVGAWILIQVILLGGYFYISTPLTPEGADYPYFYPAMIAWAIIGVVSGWYLYNVYQGKKITVKKFLTPLSNIAMKKETQGKPEPVSPSGLFGESVAVAKEPTFSERMVSNNNANMILIGFIGMMVLVAIALFNFLGKGLFVFVAIALVIFGIYWVIKMIQKHTVITILAIAAITFMLVKTNVNVDTQIGNALMWAEIITPTPEATQVPEAKMVAENTDFALTSISVVAEEVPNSSSLAQAITSLNASTKIEEAVKEVEIMSGFVNNQTQFILRQLPQKGAIIDWGTSLDQFVQSETFVDDWYENGISTDATDSKVSVPFKERLAQSVALGEIQNREYSDMMNAGRTIGNAVEKQQQLVVALQECRSIYATANNTVSKLNELQKLQLEMCWRKALAIGSDIDRNIDAINQYLAKLGSTVDVGKINKYVEALKQASENVDPTVIYTTENANQGTPDTGTVQNTSTADQTLPNQFEAPQMPNGCQPSEVTNLRYLGEIGTLWEVMQSSAMGAAVKIEEINNVSCGGAIVSIPVFSTWAVVKDLQYDQPAQGDIIKFVVDKENKNYQLWTSDLTGNSVKMLASKQIP